MSFSLSNSLFYRVCSAVRIAPLLRREPSENIHQPSPPGEHTSTIPGGHPSIIHWRNLPSIPGGTNINDPRGTITNRPRLWRGFLCDLLRDMPQTASLSPSALIKQAVEGLVAARRGLLVLGSLRGPEERCAAQNIALTLRWPVRATVHKGKCEMSSPPPSVLV